ncbi:MAG: methyltransferase [Gammaproteobacteria bacterium]|nr:MAG: methyltransferase [Gammaproteobacteria bacterium]
MPGASHPEIRKVKKDLEAPSIHGDKLWNSSLLLIDYLSKNPPEHHQTVLDAGCGWGVLSAWCAKALGADVTAVDADPSVFPYLEVVAALNNVSIHTRRARYQQLTQKQLAQYDMLVAADICFWDELVNPVYNLVNRAFKAGVKHIIIADPERSTFLEMAERSMEKHCADLIEWKLSRPVEARGALLVIENS